MTPRSGTVLVVDDNAALAENLAEILASEGISATSVDSGEAALARVAAGDVAAIITDFRLPGMTGADLIAELRRRGRRLPAIMMSAYTDADTIASSGSAGAVGFLPKPLDIARLIEIVNGLGHEDQRTVLLVDDNQAFVDNLAEALRHDGADVHISGSIAEALSLEHTPAVAIVDFRLPDGSGLDLATQLTTRDPSVQILFVSAYDSEMAARMPAPLASAPLWGKPVDTVRLVDWVKAALSHAT